MEENTKNTENTDSSGSENTDSSGSENTDDTGSENTDSSGSESTDSAGAEEAAPAATETATVEPTPEPTAEPVAETPVADDSGKRPMFLTVLGILSFIGCALQLIGSLGSLGSLTGIISILAAAGCFYGVLQMWKLKKMGFYIYAVCEIAPVVVTLITVGGAAFSLGALGGGIMVMFTTLAMFFPFLFIILYGLNLKHMS